MRYVSFQTFVQSNHRFIGKPDNHFQVMGLPNSWPAPLTVKNRYKTMMKDIALESQSSSKPYEEDDEFNIDKPHKNGTDAEPETPDEASSNQTSSAQNTTSPGNRTSKSKPSQPKSRKKSKKDRSDMTPEERRVYDKKKRIKEIYDCLMFS